MANLFNGETEDGNSSSVEVSGINTVILRKNQDGSCVYLELAATEDGDYHKISQALKNDTTVNLQAAGWVRGVITGATANTLVYLDLLEV